MKNNNNNALEFTKVHEIKDAFEREYTIACEKKNGHSKKAYGFALTILNSIDDDSISLGLRKTATNNVYNIGDLVEATLKYHLEYSLDKLKYSNSDSKDLDKRSYHEIKTMPSANRTGNAVKIGQPFLAVIESGVYYINKAMCTEYFECFKADNRLQDQRFPDLATIKLIVQEQGLKKHKYSDLLGL